MAESRLRAFFRPYLRTVYGARAPGAALGGRDPQEEIWFITIAGIRAWAAKQALPTREAVARLVLAGIWPESFRRNYGLLAAHDVARLLRCRVLVLGCGGLGGHVAELLARAGVGFLRLVDNDVFDESNLNRQRFCAQSTLGRPKALVVHDALTDMAFHLEAEALQLEAHEENMPELVRGMGAVVDCLDTIGAKMALEKAALAAGRPFIHGSILREEGFAYLNPGPDARLNTLYPEGQGAEELALSRHEAMGTLAPAGVACLMAKLCLRALLAPALEHGSDKAHEGEQAAGLGSPLYHLDLSIPELECFFWE